MKILRILSWGYESGGTENHVLLTQRILKARGHDSRVLAASDDRPELPHFNDYTFKAIGESFFERLLGYTFNLSAYLALRKIIKEFKPDVVELNTMVQASPSILFLLRKVPTTLTVHGAEPFTKALIAYSLRRSDFKHEDYDLSNLRMIGKLRLFYVLHVVYPIYRIGLRNVDVFITLSTYMQKLLAQEGIQSTNFPNAAVLMDHVPLDGKNIPHVLVYAGRLAQYKGVEYLIKAMPSVLSIFPETKLVIAGEGESKDGLVSIVEELELRSSIKFLGHVSQDQLEKEYAKASVMVMPSTWPEAFGKVGVEAMSVGRPVIATDVGGVTDWLNHGKNGLLVPPKDERAIADAVIRLFSNPEGLVRMSHEARRTAEGFTCEKLVDRYETIFCKVIDAAKKKAA